MRCPTCNAHNSPGAPFCAECGTRLGAVAQPPVITSPTGTLPQQTVLQGRYIVDAKLGQGGMGAVYRARDMRLTTAQWAVKEMSQSAITGSLERQQARESFRQEAELLAGLSHPNLPRVVDHFEQDDKAYLVMEFVPGETLLDIARREGLPMPLPRVLEWARQICEVLAYLHGHTPPIIFRDLKPANLIVTPRGEVKLVDFGIARVFKPGKARDTQAFGTMGYSAPEQYGRGQTDARSDVYALGVLLHQLLTGYDPTATPFRLPPAAQLNPSLPAGLSDVIARATDSEPERRFPDVETFRAALFGTANLVRQQAAERQMAYVGAPADGVTTPQGFASQPIGAEPMQKTTGLALLSHWIGIGSALVMALSLLLVGAAALQGNAGSSLAGAGYLLAFAPLVTGPVALILGLIAVSQSQTNATTEGRRHAVIGIAAGIATLMLCCVIFFVAGAVGSTPS